jgi:EmrB/QacA subfamily drug resistance transporter
VSKVVTDVSAGRRSRAGGYRVTYAVLAIGVAAFALLQSLVIPVLTTIREAVGTSQAAVTWMLTAYLLSAAACTPILGRLGDMMGKKRVLVGALLALAAGCALAALATSLPLLVVARVIQGAGGGVIPLAFGIVRDEFPEDKVPGAVGVIAGLASAGVGVGIVLAGPIVELLGYHWLFWVPMIMIVLAAVGAWFAVPESSTRSPGKINWGAAVLLAVWLVALLLGVSRAPTWGWGSPAVIGMLAVAVVVAVLWVVVESRSAYPLIDMRMMRIRGVWTTNLVALLVGMAMFASFAFLPAFLQTPTETGYGFGVSVTESGFLLLPQAVASFVLGLSAGRLARRFGSKRLLLVGCLIGATGFLLLALEHAHLGAIYGITLVLGIGFGLTFSAMSNLIVAAVSPEQTGVASGMNANIRTIGGSLGAAVMASLVTGHVGADGLPLERGYVAGFVLLSAALLAAAVATLFVPAVRREPSTGREPKPELDHAELALLAGGTVVGDEPE